MKVSDLKIAACLVKNAVNDSAQAVAIWKSPFDERERRTVGGTPLHHWIGVGDRHRPPVLHYLTPHRRRQCRRRFEGHRQRFGTECVRPVVDGTACCRFEELLEATDRGEDEHAGTLGVALPDDGKAGAVNIECRDIHSQYLLVTGD